MLDKPHTILNEALLLLTDDLIMLALPLFLFTVVVEAGYSYRRNFSWYEKEDFWTSIGIMLTTVVVDFLPKLIGVLAMIKLHEISPLRDLIGRQWWCWVVLFFLDDFTY